MRLKKKDAFCIEGERMDEQEIKVVLIGTDSLRGKEMKSVLERAGFLSRDVKMFDPDVEEEFSKLTEFAGEARAIRHLDEDSLSNADIVFLAASKKINRIYGFKAKDQHFRAIDLSEAFNRNKAVPLIVAGVNDKTVLKEDPALVANPHPVSIFLSHALHILCEQASVRKAVAFVLQPVSAYEEAGINELASQSIAMLGSEILEKKVFPEQVAFNLLSPVGTPDKNGFSRIEKQTLAEIRRILNNKKLPLTLSMIQVPVFHTYAVMMYVELEEKFTAEKLLRIYAGSPYFQLFSREMSNPVSSVSVAGKDRIHIGPVKKDPAGTNGYWIWLVADNLTRGSALNALEIAQEMLPLIQDTP